MAGRLCEFVRVRVAVVIPRLAARRRLIYITVSCSWAGGLERCGKLVNFFARGSSTVLLMCSSGSPRYGYVNLFALAPRMRPFQGYVNLFGLAPGTVILICSFPGLTFNVIQNACEGCFVPCWTRYGYVNLFVSCSAMVMLICSVSKRCQFYGYVNLFGGLVVY